VLRVRKASTTAIELRHGADPKPAGFDRDDRFAVEVGARAALTPAQRSGDEILAGAHADARALVTLWRVPHPAPPFRSQLAMPNAIQELAGHEDLGTTQRYIAVLRDASQPWVSEGWAVRESDGAFTESGVPLPICTGPCPPSL
jgi:hypothetical protein